MENKEYNYHQQHQMQTKVNLILVEYLNIRVYRNQYSLLITLNSELI